MGTLYHVWRVSILYGLGGLGGLIGLGGFLTRACGCLTWAWWTEQVPYADWAGSFLRGLGGLIFSLVCR